MNLLAEVCFPENLILDWMNCALLLEVRMLRSIHQCFPTLVPGAHCPACFRCFPLQLLKTTSLSWSLCRSLITYSFQSGMSEQVKHLKQDQGWETLVWKQGVWGLVFWIAVLLIKEFKPWYYNFIYIGLLVEVCQNVAYKETADCLSEMLLVICLWQIELIIV